MTLTIEITPELEHQINQAAEKAGLSPDIYVLQLLPQLGDANIKRIQAVGALANGQGEHPPAF